MERNRQEELTDAPHRTHRDIYQLPYMHTTYRMKAPGEQRRDPKIAVAELALQKTAAKFGRSSSLQRKRMYVCQCSGQRLGRQTRRRLCKPNLHARVGNEISDAALASLLHVEGALVVIPLINSSSDIIGR